RRLAITKARRGWSGPEEAGRTRNGIHGPNALRCYAAGRAGELICYALAQTDRTRLRYWLRLGITAAALTMAAVSVFLKLAQPYCWMSWLEPPVWNATAIPHLPELRGMRLSPSTIDTVETATAAIQGACAPGE